MNQEKNYIAKTYNTYGKLHGHCKGICLVDEIHIKHFRLTLLIKHLLLFSCTSTKMAIHCVFQCLNEFRCARLKDNEIKDNLQIQKFLNYFCDFDKLLDLFNFRQNQLIVRSNRKVVVLFIV